MFEPLCVERVPSRIQNAAACIAYGRNPNSSHACWSSCTITRALDLHFHCATEGPHPRVPGAREKKKTPHFFRLSCPTAVPLLPSNFSPAHVVSCAFSARSETSGGGIAAELPTIAILLRPSPVTSLLLLLHPLLSGDGVVTYASTSYPAPESVQHALLAYGGDTVVLLESCALRCYAMRPDDGALRRVPVQYNSAIQGRVMWASTRPPLRESRGALLEILLVTDHAMAAVVSICTDGSALSGRCVWGVPLMPAGELACADKDADADARGLLERWDTTVAFARALSAPLPLLKYHVGADTERTRDLFSVPPVVCASENGAVLCVIPLKADEAFLVAMGSTDDDHINIDNSESIECAHGDDNVKEKGWASAGSDASVSVALPAGSFVYDAVWAGGGFVLLGAALLFLPLVGRARRVAHAGAVSGASSILSHGNATDMFGNVRVRMALRCVDAATGAVTVQAGALSPPHTRATAMPPHMIYRLMRLTGLAAFNRGSHSIPGHVPHSIPGHVPHSIPGHVDPLAGVIACSSIGSPAADAYSDALRLSLEVSLDVPMDPFPPVVFPLRHVLNDSLARVLDTLQRPCASDIAIAKALTVLRATFAGVAAALADAALPSSAPLLSRWLPDLHGVISALRRALFVVARRGALSAVFACAGLVAALSAVQGNTALPQWHVLAAPLADDAVALLAPCPSLARALVPYCSAPVRAMVALADVVAERPVDDADMCGAAQRVFLTGGAGAVREYVQCAGGDAQIRSLCAEYDSIEREVISAQCMA